MRSAEKGGRDRNYELALRALRHIGVFIKKLVRLFSSLKLAVLIILALAILTAAGTIVESRYNAEVAAKLVYRTWMMHVVLSLLAITLIAVMIDRWPWKKKHIPFILAHIGILVLQLGFVLTGEYGLDGSMRFGLGEANQFVTVNETELQIWSSFDGDRYTKLFGQPVDFYINPPEKKPISISLPKGQLSIVDYAPFVIPQRKIHSSENDKRGSALRFLVKNDRVNVSEWLFQSRKSQLASHNMGPAKFYLGPLPVKNVKDLPAENAIYLEPVDRNKIKYVVTYKDANRKINQGIVEEGGSFQTGWMNLEFKILRYHLFAEESLEVKKLKYPTELSTSAILVDFNGQKQWVQVNDVFKFFSEDAVYIVTYGNRRIDLGFNLMLKNFEIGRNPGTTRAATYKSTVVTPDGQENHISMNEPLKYRGLTFYQASFQDGPDGVPVASILSVNHDPGRWLKYLGSLILSLGVIWLFYDRRKAARARAPESGNL